MRRARFALAALALVAAAGCATGSVDLALLSSPSDTVVWEAGQKAVARKDWESARQYFKRLVDGFPHSEHQPAARLAVADTYFEEGGTANYVLAASAYHEFLTLYPQHPKSDYAQFRAGDSYFKQRNSPDRDQTQTNEALAEYEKLLDIYPDSSYAESARARVQELRQGLARSHYLVGFFYQRGRQAWRSAIGRYEAILKDYPDYQKLDEVLYRYAECLAASGRYAEALPTLARLKQEFPKSSYTGEADRLRASFPPASVPTAPGDAAAKGAPPAAPAGEARPATPPVAPAPAPEVQGATVRPPS